MGVERKMNLEFWGWMGRAVAVFFILVLWIRSSHVKTIVQLSYIEVILGLTMSVVGAFIIITDQIQISYGLPLLAVFGLMSRIAIQLLKPNHVSLEKSSTAILKPKTYTFILDGQLLPSALEPLGKDIDWVVQLLQSYDIPSIERVALAQIDHRDRIIISQKGSSNDPKILH